MLQRPLKLRLHKARRWRTSSAVPSTPSGSLIAALQSAGHYSAIPPDYVNKLDLSYIDPKSVGRKRPQKTKFQLLPGQTAIALQTILARFIRHVYSNVGDEKWSSTAVDKQRLDDTLLKVCNEEVLAYLQSRGHTIEDLMTWSWIITAVLSEEAATRLMMIAGKERVAPGIKGNLIPTSVFLFVLRREQVSAQALRLLMLHGWSRIYNKKSNLWATKIGVNLEEATMPDSWSARRWKSSELATGMYPKMDEKTIMIMIIRFLRHARKVWPQALVSIAAMISTHINNLSFGAQDLPHSPLRGKRIRHLTFLYNRILSLLAMPSSINPYSTVPYHQRAQFNILKHMSTFRPPLPINREGYRAVVKIQLAHKKTLQECDWAKMKASSWPPWKEERLGIDVDKGVEHGISRATEAMFRMNEAGYANSSWEKVASILAGWDTDKSPTIQTRSIIRRAPVGLQTNLRDESERKHNRESIAAEDDPDVWASRIRATRTVQEAWACFIAYDDRQLSPTQEMYFAMFEKIYFERNNQNYRENHGTSSELESLSTPKDVSRPFPGDGKEVSPAPLSPYEAIYVPSQPPSLDELFDRMLKNGIRPTDKCLAFLVSHAASLHAGLHFLRAGGFFQDDIFDVAIYRRIGDHRIDDIPQNVFVALVKLLCRFAATKGHDSLHEAEASPELHFARSKAQLKPAAFTSSPLLLAFKLMYSRKPPYRPPWNALLSALARHGAILSPEQGKHMRISDDILSWNISIEVVQQMRKLDLQLDMQGFQIICTGLEKALLASRTRVRSNGSKRNGPRTIDMKKDARDVLQHGIEFIKAAFKTMLGVFAGPTSPQPCALHSKYNDRQYNNGIDPSVLLPSLLAIPGPSQLHAYIRVLGISGDYDELLVLITWMAMFAPELQAIADEARNGRKLLRRCLVAVRMFLEYHWQSSHISYASRAFEEPFAPQEIIAQIKNVVEGIESWGGWPGDEEVRVYGEKGRFP
ncbi:MAG: hypothetical protein M1827_000091 [Pycnora praestabilis]|nr:MAG: hypothetical protein M1827_000091 [Pycnora praestabilis]